jgi:hypothetical protein
MRWRTVTLLATLFLASLCWGQYQTTYQTGVSDITSYLPTVNAWKQIGPLTTFISISESSYGDIYGLDSSGCGWSYDRSTQQYTSQSWGCGWSEITTDFYSSSVIVGLLKADSGCPSGTKRFYWWYGTGQPQSTGCAAHWYGSTDNSALQLELNGGDSQFWNGPNGTYTDIGTGWTAGSIVNSNLACAIKGGQVYLWQDNATFGLMSTQPASSGVSGCNITVENDSMFAWGAFGVKRFDFASGTWNVVSGISVSAITSAYKGTTLALDSTYGQPHHLNVYAGFIKGTTNGSYNFCVNQCGSGVLHTAQLTVKLPHGLSGILGMDKEAPTVNVNASSFDFSPVCDPFLGAPSDPECQAQATGSVICSQSGENFQTGGPPAPPAIPTAPSHFSEYVGSWDQSWSIINQRHIMANTYLAIIQCGATKDSCAPGTSAICSPPNIQGQVTEGGLDSGPSATQAGALNAAKLGCAKHLSIAKPGAWGIFSSFNYVNGVVSCAPIAVYDEKPGFPCY